MAVLAAARLSNRSDWPPWAAMVAVGALVTMLAGAGIARLLADPAVHWGWVAAGALISAGGVWAGVPETGPAVVVGGVFAGLVTAAALTRASWAPSAGVGVAAALGWAALSGAVGRPWASVGGALCTGMAPWLAIRPLLPTLSWSRNKTPINPENSPRAIFDRLFGAETEETDGSVARALPRAAFPRGDLLDS